MGWKEPLDSVTDDQIETRSAKSLCGYPVPPPWDINFGDGTVRRWQMCKQPKKHRMRNVGHSLGASESPDALSIAEDRIASGPRVQRAPGVPHASHRGRGMQADDGAPAPQTMGAMTHV